MTRYIRQKGFSLTEVLMATGVLAMGLMLVAMAFPVGVKLVSVSTERAIADAAVGEAVANMRLYAGSLPAGFNLAQMIPATNSCIDFTGALSALSGDVRFYPSLVPLEDEDKRYCWSILARRTDLNTNEVQTTVLVCRMQVGGKYYPADYTTNTDYADAPVPVKVEVQKTGTGDRQLEIIPTTNSPEYKFFTEGCRIIEDATGHPWRVLELKDVDGDGNRDLILQDDYTGADPGYVWVVPPPVGSSRNPCLRVWQSDLTFP